MSGLTSTAAKLTSKRRKQSFNKPTPPSATKEHKDRKENHRTEAGNEWQGNWKSVRPFSAIHSPAISLNGAAACSAALKTSFNFRSFVSGSFALQLRRHLGTDSRKGRA